VKGRLLGRSDLTVAEREAMLRLLDAHFEGVDRHVFERDLAGKNWVLLLEEDGILRGFSTLLLYETTMGGEACAVVYSGDTIMDRVAWGSSALSRCWIGSIQALRRLHPRGSLYWLLLTSGFRTYRFLPVFWREFYPRHDAPTPPEARSRMEALASDQFGAQYSPADGIVRFGSPQVLRDGLAELPAAKLADPHTLFFLEQNPGWVRGDELVCLTEISPSNLTRAGERMWREGARTLLVPQTVE
jgi:hypothetical protein